MGIQVTTKNAQRYKLGGWAANNSIGFELARMGWYQQWVSKVPGGYLARFIDDDVYRRDYFDHSGNPNHIIYIPVDAKDIDGKYQLIWKKLIPDTTITTSNTWYKECIHSYTINYDEFNFISFNKVEL